jgi:hypothetical protein
MLCKHPELEFKLELNPFKPFSRKKPKKENETLPDSGVEIKIFTGLRTAIVIHHDDGKGYTYAVLNQLYQKSWGNDTLIRKPNEPSYYRNDVKLQAYVQEMIKKVTNHYGAFPKEGNTWIGERGLIFIPRIYNRLLIVFHTFQRNRKIHFYFPESRILLFSFDTDSYNDTIDSQILKMEQQQLGEGKHFDDLTCKRIIKYFSDFTKGKVKIKTVTTIKKILIYCMLNPDVIALWISDIPHFSIVSLLVKDNDQPGYISEDIESNLVNLLIFMMFKVF